MHALCRQFAIKRLLNIPLLTASLHYGKFVYVNVRTFMRSPIVFLPNRDFVYWRKLTKWRKLAVVTKILIF